MGSSCRATVAVPRGTISGSPTPQLPSWGDVVESGWEKENAARTSLHGHGAQPSCSPPASHCRISLSMSRDRARVSALGHVMGWFMVWGHNWGAPVYWGVWHAGPCRPTHPLRRSAWWPWPLPPLQGLQPPHCPAWHPAQCCKGGLRTGAVGNTWGAGVTTRQPMLWFCGRARFWFFQFQIKEKRISSPRGILRRRRQRLVHSGACAGWYSLFKYLISLEVWCGFLSLWRLYL